MKSHVHELVWRNVETSLWSYTRSNSRWNFSKKLVGFRIRVITEGMFSQTGVSVRLRLVDLQNNKVIKFE